ncbi:hypothetical protein BDZ97DRAFT_797260 [Flammula alnicola]|nr:hypothetical protein BDZ97DRAFT_797260 [Flammula alnicola]
MKPTQSNESREVNSLLHTLRGEQFRHLQNVRQSRTHLSLLRNYNAPTLPIGLRMPDYDPNSTDASPRQNTLASYSGPAPPKSWRPSPEKEDHETVAWRARALSLAASYLGNFTETPRVPSLALLCLKMILSNCTSSTEFREDVVPYIPPHLRRDVIRYCAIHSPLPNWKLYALFNPQGNADGEILIMGPTASLHDDHFLRGRQPSEESNSSIKPTTKPEDDQDWESEDLSDTPLLSLILVSTRLPTSTLFAFPPTITRLALINLSTSVPLHRLPKICPLLVLLDLSYNVWLKDPMGEGGNSLEKVPWTRWNHLEVLGLRDCYISDGLLQRVNKGRWDDVKVVR